MDASLRSRRRRLTVVPLLLPLLLTAVLLLAACSGGSDTDDAGEAAAPAAREMNGAEAPGDARRLATAFEAESKVNRANSDDDFLTTRAVISKGVVSVLGRDLGATRFDVQKIVDVHEGEITEEETETDDDGEVRRSRLVVRVPVARFDEAMDALEDVAQLESSSRNSEDVTTEVIDTEVRIRAQSESLRRVEVLLARAQSIRDIVAIEAQLTRRQADLDSLKSRQAYLADQTSMSTIAVLMETLPEKDKKADEDETGFLAGLADGWRGLKTATNGVATAVGMLLPFAVVLLVLGLPLWWLGRRALRRRSAVPSEAAQTG